MIPLPPSSANFERKKKKRRVARVQKRRDGLTGRQPLDQTFRQARIVG